MRLLISSLLVTLITCTAFGQATQPAQRTVGKPLLLVLCKAENQLALVDPDSMRLIAKMPTGNGPHEVAASADGKLAFVSNYGDQKTPGSTLSMFDLVERKPLRTVDLGVLRRPHGIVASANGKVYFTAELNAVVGRYDPATDKIDGLTGTGASISHMLARDQKTGRIWTANIMSDSVTLIDPRGPFPKVTQIKSHQSPEGIALAPDAKMLWVGNNKSSDIVLIDTSSNEIVQTIDCGGGGVPIRLAFAPDGKRVLASDAKAGDVIVFDAESYKEAGRIRVGQVPVGITVSNDSSRAFVATTGDGKVSCIDLSKLSVIGSLEVGDQPDGITWVELR
jgi:YVTN family beta-propeller protein